MYVCVTPSELVYISSFTEGATPHKFIREETQLQAPPCGEIQNSQIHLSSNDT